MKPFPWTAYAMGAAAVLAAAWLVGRMRLPRLLLRLPLLLCSLLAIASRSAFR